MGTALAQRLALVAVPARALPAADAEELLAARGTVVPQVGQPEVGLEQEQQSKLAQGPQPPAWQTVIPRHGAPMACVLRGQAVWRLVRKVAWLVGR